MDVIYLLSRGHHSSEWGHPTSRDALRQRRQPMEDRWPWAGAMEVSVKDSPIWHHRSLITTGHPVELSKERERSPGNNSKLNCCGQRVSVTPNGTNNLSHHLLVLLSLLDPQQESVKLEAYFHTYSLAKHWLPQPASPTKPANSFSFYSTFTLHEAFIATKADSVDKFFGSFGHKSVCLGLGFLTLVREEKPRCIKEQLTVTSSFPSKIRTVWCDWLFFLFFFFMLRLYFFSWQDNVVVDVSVLLWLVFWGFFSLLSWAFTLWHTVHDPVGPFW